MMLAISNKESDQSKQGGCEQGYFNPHLPGGEQHDSFLSNGSSPTEVSSPSSSTDSTSSDEGVDMASSPTVSSRDEKINKNLLDKLQNCRKKSLSPDPSVLQAYRKLSLQEKNDDKEIDDQPIDLSTKSKKKSVVPPSQSLDNEAPTQNNYHWPFTSAGKSAGFWHPGMFLRNNLSPATTINPFMATQHLTTSSALPLLGLPFLTTAPTANNRPMMYDPNVLAEFSRLLAVRQSLASNLTQNAKSSSCKQNEVLDIKQERLSNCSSPASSTGSHKRKADDDKSMSLNRVSTIGSDDISEDSNDSSASYTQAEKRPKLQSHPTSFFSDLPTYIEQNSHFPTPPTMVTGVYNQTTSTPNKATKDPTPIDFKPCRYPCTSCGRTYATIGGLVKHSKTHHDPESSKVFKCKSCDKEYTSLGALKMHIRTHTLPCKCHICGKAFSRTWLLQGHIRTHTGEKPYQCSVCMRAFADRSNLRAHMQTHETVKRYACTSCDKTYSRISLLNRHQANGCSNNANSQES